VKVVVADDCAEMRRLIRSLLPSDSDIIECSDGQSAIEACQNLSPDWALLDIGMAPVDGLSAARRLRETSSAIQVILVTAHDESRWRAAAAELGVRGYVLKDSLEEINPIIASSERNREDRAP